MAQFRRVRHKAEQRRTKLITKLTALREEEALLSDLNRSLETNQAQWHEIIQQSDRALAVMRKNHTTAAAELDDQVNELMGKLDSTGHGEQKGEN
jgi:asparagine synthetase A